MVFLEQRTQLPLTDSPGLRERPPDPTKSRWDFTAFQSQFSHTSNLAFLKLFRRLLVCSPPSRQEGTALITPLTQNLPSCLIQTENYIFRPVENTRGVWRDGEKSAFPRRSERVARISRASHPFCAHLPLEFRGKKYLLKDTPQRKSLFLLVTPFLIQKY